MAVMDEFKEERESIKNASFKDKAIYFFDYYKGHVIGAVLIIWIVGSLIHQWVTHKDIVFTSIMLNSTQLETIDDSYRLGFAEKAGIDMEEYDVLFDTGMYITDNYYDETVSANMQKLMVYQMAGDVDTMIADYDSAESYVYNGSFDDIRNYMTAQQIEKLEPYFIYADQAIIDAKAAAQEANQEPLTVDYPSPTRPEEMENPVPIGISLKDCPKARTQYYSSGTMVNLYIFKCTQHPEYCQTFIDYICAEVLD